MEEEKRKWYQLDSRGLSNLIVVCSGILLYLVLTHLPQVKAALEGFVNVLAPFILGFVIAFLLNAPTNFFEQKVYAKLKQRRILAVVTVYAIALLLIVVLLQLVIPQVGESLISLVNNLSGYLENLSKMVDDLSQRFGIEWEGLSEIVADYQTIIRNALNFATSSLPQLLNFGVAVGNGVVTTLTAFIVSIYMLAGKARLIRQLKKLIYACFPAKGASRILSACSRADEIFVGFINGKLIDSAIIGLLCFVLTTIFQIPYAILVSVVVGVTNVVPFFGPIIGAIPCLMILVIVDPWAALRFGIMIVALQQFDGNILGPKILGSSTGLSAMWVLVAIVVGSGLFGFAGMLLGVPTFAVLYAFVRDWAEERLRRKGIDADGKPLEPAEEKGAEPSEV